MPNPDTRVWQQSHTREPGLGKNVLGLDSLVPSGNKKTNKPARFDSPDASAKPEPRIPQRFPNGAGDVITLTNRYSSLEEMSMNLVEHHTPAQIKETKNKMATIIQWNCRGL